MHRSDTPRPDPDRDRRAYYRYLLDEDSLVDIGADLRCDAISAVRRHAEALASARADAQGLLSRLDATLPAGHPSAHLVRALALALLG